MLHPASTLDHLPRRANQRLPVDLFEHAGIPLAHQDKSGARLSGQNPSYLVDASVYEIQLAFDLGEIKDGVVYLIPRTGSTFMEAPLRSMLRSNREHTRATNHLMKQGLLYVGDITGLSLAQLRKRLGPYSHLAREIEAKVKALGLRLDADAPWWKQPCDYYRRCY